MDSTLVARLSNFRVLNSQLIQSIDYDKQTVTRLTGKIEVLKTEVSNLTKAVALIDRCIEVISSNGIGKIESIVTGGLLTVFGKDSDLRLVIEKKETARGYSYRILAGQGDVVGDPMKSFGGGVQNVIAFLLRVILLKRFKLFKFLVLDESFSNVSEGHLPQVSGMLKSLTDDHGFTILVITHQPKLAEAADSIYEVLPSKPPTLIKQEYGSIQEGGLLGDEAS